MKQKHPSEGSSAFTLIEMLVVITIIALLASVIVPGVSSSMHRSRTAAGMSNLRQIGQAFQIYANENQGRLPYEIGVDGETTWHVAINPYLEDFSLDELNARIGQRPVGVFACPNSRNITRSDNYADYGMNIYVNGSETDQNGVPRRLFEITQPSHVILVGDSANVNRLLRPGSVDALLDRRQGSRRDSANILYVDGRVSTGKVDSLWLDISGNRQQQFPWGWPGWREPGN